MRIIFVFLAVFWVLAGAAQGSTLADVTARGTLKCGVNAGLLGFAQKDESGVWAGFDVDYCKALAAATLGDPAKIEFVPATVTDRFDRLAKGEIDVLARNTTWTLERETKWPLRFAGVSYHDGQGFLMKTLMGVTSVFNMSNAAVCVLKGTTNEANLGDFFGEHDMPFAVVAFDSSDDAIKAYEDGKCDAYTSDQSQLYAVRLRMAKPDDHLILPEVISKEPLGPVVRADDAQWFNITRWTLFALINAEELGVRQPNVDDEAAKNKSGPVKRLLGVEGVFGEALGLDKAWAARALKAVGNYGEMFDRNLGQGSKLGIERGLNALWNNGGILYAPPVR